MVHVLVTGGAGYFGCVLVPYLLDRSYEVTVVDNLMYGGLGLVPYFMDPNFKFKKVSILEDISGFLRKADFVVHLAAIVGYPASKKNPELTRAVNYEGTERLVRQLTEDQKLIFPSTVSCYGEHISASCTEETPLNPISLYGVTKANAEKVVLRHANTIVYRFATAFGLSPRLRLDLLINDFTYQAMKNKQLIIYEKDFQRCFIHVRDMARAILFAIDNFERMKGQIFNVGSPEMNLTKEAVAAKLKEKLDFVLAYIETGHDEDRRNYFVSFDKIHKLGFTCNVDFEKGLAELIAGLEVVDIRNPFSNV